MNNEIIHGRKLAQSDPELIWGWKTPAGKIRAARRAEMIVSGARLGPGVLALEIGCGTGMFTEMFARTGAKLIAVDISIDLLDIARKRGLPKDRVDFIEKRFEDVGELGPFDAVIGSSVLHHLDIEKSLKKIYELLKPGGYASFAEPNMINPQLMLQKNVPILRKLAGESPDETAFIKWPFERLLSRTGFKEIKINSFDWLHPSTPSALIERVMYIGGILEKTPFIKELAGSLHIECCRPKSNSYS